RRSVWIVHGNLVPPHARNFTNSIRLFVKGAHGSKRSRHLSSSVANLAALGTETNKAPAAGTRTRLSQIRTVRVRTAAAKIHGAARMRERPEPPMQGRIQGEAPRPGAALLRSLVSTGRLSGTPQFDPHDGTRGRPRHGEGACADPRRDLVC